MLLAVINKRERKKDSLVSTKTFKQGLGTFSVGTAVENVMP